MFVMCTMHRSIFFFYLLLCLWKNFIFLFLQRNSFSHGKHKFWGIMKESQNKFIFFLPWAKSARARSSLNALIINKSESKSNELITNFFRTDVKRITNYEFLSVPIAIEIWENKIKWSNKLQARENKDC